jgi:hypothetical protein
MLYFIPTLSNSLWLINNFAFLVAFIIFAIVIEARLNASLILGVPASIPFLSFLISTILPPNESQMTLNYGKSVFSKHRNNYLICCISVI